MLSRFSYTFKHDVTIATMDEHHNVFVSMGKQKLHEVDSPRFSIDLILCRPSGFQAN